MAFLAYCSFQERKKMQGKTLGLLTILLLSWFNLSEGKQNEKTARIGFLSPSSSEVFKGPMAAFRAALQELGYFEGENIVIEERYAAGMFERLPTLLAQLTKLQVDLLVVQGGAAVDAAKKATSITPIVMVGNSDPVGRGHVASLARPGGNITGLSESHVGMVTKRLELLREVVPSAPRVAVMLERSDPAHMLQLKELQSAAPRLSLTIVPVDVKGSDDFDRVFAMIRKDRAGALVVFGDRLFSSDLKQIAKGS
jgi:putative ABC transport system substrate-binding protein